MHAMQRTESQKHDFANRKSSFNCLWIVKFIHLVNRRVYISKLVCASILWYLRDCGWFSWTSVKHLGWFSLCFIGNSLQLYPFHHLMKEDEFVTFVQSNPIQSNTMSEYLRLFDSTMSSSHWISFFQTKVAKK